MRTLAQPDAFEHGLRLTAPRLAPRAGIHQRQRDVIERSELGQQVEALEHEADLAVAQGSQLIRRQSADILPVETVTAAAGAIEAAEQIHEGALARARRPHDGDEFALGDAKADPAKRLEHASAGLLVFLEILH